MESGTEREIQPFLPQLCETYMHMHIQWISARKPTVPFSRKLGKHVHTTLAYKAVFQYNFLNSSSSFQKSQTFEYS